MWHEARKQERKIRGMLVDYRKRAERRRDFYEKIKADPTQFLQVHGRQCKIHLDPAIAAAADGPATMMPWQGNNDNMIDRFDVRAHLDHIPNVSTPEEEELSLEERQINYERYRIVAQNNFLVINEEKFLKQLLLEEQFGYTENEPKKKKPSTGVAIGFNYEDGTGPSQVPPNPEEENSDENSDSDVDVDLSINVSKLEQAQAHEMNRHGRNYGMSSNDFYSFLTNDLEEAESFKLAKEEEHEKALFSGRKSRRERRAHREKRLANRKISPPSYAARESPTLKVDLHNKSESRSPSPENAGKITFITSFGDDEEPPMPSKPTYADKVKFGSKLRKMLREDTVVKPWVKFITHTNAHNRSSTGSTGEKVIFRRNNRDQRRSTRSRSRRIRSRRSSYSSSSSSSSTSRSRSRSRRRSRSWSRRRSYSRSPSIKSRHRKRNKSSSSPPSRSSYKRRRSSSSSSSTSSNSKTSRSRSRSRSSSSSVTSRSDKSAATARNRYRSRSKSSKSRSRSRDNNHQQRALSTTRSRSRSRSVSVVNNSQLNAEEKSPKKEDELQISTTVTNSNKTEQKTEQRPLPRYYGRKKSDQSSSELTTDEESVVDKPETPNPENSNAKGGNSGTSTKKSANVGPVLSLQERLKRKRQAQLAKQFNADKIAERLKTEREKQEQQSREDEMRELSLKLRKKHRERRYAYESDSNASNSSGSGSRTNVSSKSARGGRNSRSRSPSPPKKKERDCRSRERDYNKHHRSEYRDSGGEHKRSRYRANSRDNRYNKRSPPKYGEEEQKRQQERDEDGFYNRESRRRDYSHNDTRSNSNTHKGLVDY